MKRKREVLSILTKPNNQMDGERVPQDIFLGSIVMRNANQFVGMLLSFSGTRQSSGRYTLKNSMADDLFHDLQEAECKDG